LLSNRHQFDINLLTTACPDAILESVEAIARLMPTTLNRRVPEQLRRIAAQSRHISV